MNTTTKQIIIGIVITIASATVFGVQNLYDDIQRNTHHREEAMIMMQKIDSKLDEMMKYQIETRRDIAVLQNNQKLIMEGKLNE